MSWGRGPLRGIRRLSDAVGGGGGTPETFTKLASPARLGHLIYIVSPGGGSTASAADSAQSVPATGKFYFEAHIARSSEDGAAFVGLYQSSTNRFGKRAGDNSDFIWNDNGGGQTIVTGSLTYGWGADLKFAVDMDAGKFWAGKVGGGWDAYGGASPDPATGTSPMVTFTTPLSGTWYIRLALLANSGDGFDVAGIALPSPQSWMDTPPDGFGGVPG